MSCLSVDFSAGCTLIAMPRALLSVSDKTGSVEFARGLAARGFELVSTGGTALTLAAGGLPVIGVSDVTGFPEMMDGRVKTLHPQVHGGILARRDRGPTISRPPREHGITLIDLVVVNLYPFVDGRAESGHAVRRADRGDRHRRAEPGARGGQELRGRARGRVAGRLRRGARRSSIAPGGPSPAFRFELARKAFAHTGALRHGDRVDAGDGHGRTTPGSRARAPAALARRAWRSTCARCAICATARTRISARRWYAGIRRRIPAYADAAGQGAVVHEPARSRRRARIVLEFNEPAAARHQAHQPVRRRDRHERRRRLRARARGRCAVGVRRHRRA